ncbi:MAG: hypothetical protein ACK56F_30205, partial [bacterium]
MVTPETLTETYIETVHPHDSPTPVYITKTKVTVETPVVTILSYSETYIPSWTYSPQTIVETKTFTEMPVTE